MLTLEKKGSFGPRANKNMILGNKQAERSADQTDCSSVERADTQTHSTCNSSMEKDFSNFDEKQTAVHDEFYTQICNTKSQQQEQDHVNITDDDLQSIYQTNECVEEGVLKQMFTLDYNTIQTKEEALQFLNNWAPIKPITNEEIRTNDAHKEGGKICLDKLLVSTLRNVSKEVIKQIGRKLISGDFNLTTISFPIRAMIPKSFLEGVLFSTCYYPLYMNKAAQTKDPLERMKLVITASFSSYVFANNFYKPLNPILGETLEGGYIDGTKMFAEQISHHPPISYTYIVGPNKSYTSYGYGDYEASAGLNSLKIKNSGKKTVKFQDGQTITFNQGYEHFSGTFFGTTRHETLGVVEFEDKQNDITCSIKIGKVKKRPTDYFEGEIKYKGKSACKVYGTYLGYIDFDGMRYWDFRNQLPFKNNIYKSKLQSDHNLRPDKIQLSSGNIAEAQKAKEMLEQIQRNDRKLRKDHEANMKTLKKKMEKDAKKEEKEAKKEAKNQEKEAKKEAKLLEKQEKEKIKEAKKLAKK